MIVRPSGSSQLLISQPDHAALAGQIMRHWIAGELPTARRRPDILLAIDQHDNGWAEADAAPIVDTATGRIIDFMHAPGEVRRQVWPRGIERLAATPYAAALVAQHALHLYARFRSDGDWTPFFDEIESARDRHLRATPDSTLDELQRDYRFVRLGDLMSLVFCNAWQEPQTEAGYSLRLEGTSVVIAPDPFGGRSVPVEVSAIELPDRPFSSSADAHRALAAAPHRIVAGMVRGETPG